MICHLVVFIYLDTWTTGHDHVSFTLVFIREDDDLLTAHIKFHKIQYSWQLTRLVLCRPQTPFKICNILRLVAWGATEWTLWNTTTNLLQILDYFDPLVNSANVTHEDISFFVRKENVVSVCCSDAGVHLNLEQGLLKRQDAFFLFEIFETMNEHYQHSVKKQQCWHYVNNMYALCQWS